MGDRKAPRPVDTTQVKPTPPPAPPRKRMPLIINRKYYVHMKGHHDVWPCSRCHTEPAVFLHTAWIVVFPTLCAQCYMELFGGES